MRREHPGHTLSSTAVVHETLDRLAGLLECQSLVVTLRYFGGMTVPEIAAALEVSAGTVERDWRIARAWLNNELGGKGVG
jgi:DNA-directed RNA polymerase specialized sigma24 family protein